MAEQQWFVVRGGREEGPFTGTQLKEMASSGKLKPTDLVRRADVEMSRPASAIKGLFPSETTGTERTSKPQKSPVLSEKEEQKDSRKAATRKKLLILSGVAGAFLFLCCGGFGLIGMFGSKSRETTRKDAATSGSGSEYANGEAGDDHIIRTDTPLTTIPESVTQNPFQLSADGSYLLANGSSVWNVKTGKKLHSPESFLWSKLSPSGKRLAAIQVGGPKKLVIFSLEPDRLVVQQKIDLGHRDCLGPVWSQEENRIAVTCRGPVVQTSVNNPPEAQDGFIITLEESAHRVVPIVQPDHLYRVTYPEPHFSSDGKILAVTLEKPSDSNKRVLSTFETATGKHLETVETVNKPSTPNETWELRLVPNDDGRIEVWRVAENRLTAVVGKPDGVNRSFRAVTPDGRIVASAQHEKRGVEIWDTGMGQKVSLKEYKQSLGSGARPDYLNKKAPPVSDSIYEQIRSGMTTLQVWKLVGGKPYDDQTERREEGRLGTDWIMEKTEFYHSKDHPGAKIVLVFRGKGSAPPLIKKTLVR